jgi:hypothetical protein
MTDVILVFFFEFVVTRGCKCRSPKDEGFFYIKSDSLHMSDCSKERRGKSLPLRIIRIANDHNGGDVFLGEGFCEDFACIEDNA